MERRRSRIRTAKKSTKQESAAKAIKAVPMTTKRLQHLKGLGHGLDPVLSVGKDGITEGVVAACSEQLRAHELIKVKVQPEAPEDRHVSAENLAGQVQATLVQVMGRTFLLYKRNPQKPKIDLAPH
jgi:RNA-binding protein